jgi:hypothetical protein
VHPTVETGERGEKEPEEEVKEGGKKSPLVSSGGPGGNKDPVDGSVVAALLARLTAMEKKLSKVSSKKSTPSTEEEEDVFEQVPPTMNLVTPVKHKPARVNVNSAASGSKAGILSLLKNASGFGSNSAPKEQSNW